MNELKGTGLRLNPPASGDKGVEISVNGETIHARLGEPLAAALLAAGYRVLRHTPGTGAPRGMYCGMGVCYECLVSVNGQQQVRACMMRVEPNMRVEIDNT
jgi:aerobic-type carbon monoxide dehydrogenase small subunit (CoxS/CutS family)